MSGPLLEAVEGYLAKGRSRFHMPGHKGADLALAGSAAAYDITEADGCDSLYEANGAIAETEAAFAELYGAGASCLSAGGSTLCIQAMLALAAAPGETVVIARGVHASAVNAMALLGIRPVWVYGETVADTGLALPPSPALIEEALRQNPAAKAVYLTSPNYFGQMADLAGIATVCRRFGVRLIVDNAHGAHLKFFGGLHPMDQGADMCADSLHKTLPVLTGGALLHLRDKSLYRAAKQKMSLFGSTSPSYLIMLSADAVLGQLRGDYPAKMCEIAGEMASLQSLAVRRGFCVSVGDPLRLSLGFFTMGYEKEEFSRLIRDAGIEPEYISGGFCVLMATPENTARDFGRLRDFLANLPQRPPLPVSISPVVRPLEAVPLREAALAPSESVMVENAVGRVAASTVSACPPGIPLAVPGERIDGNLGALLKSCGIYEINVLI